MTHQIFTLPKSAPLNSGVVMPGAKASFFLTTTSTPTPVYTTSALSTTHTQPVVADAAGVLPAIYLDPAISYKVTLTTTADVLYYTQDPVNDQLLSQGVVGSYLYPRTTAEIAAGVTPTNYFYTSDAQQGQINVKRYGAGGGVASAVANKAAIQTAISVAAESANCTITVPQDCAYGYVITTRSTWPDFSGVTNDMLVIDQSTGSSYAAPAKDGMQVRYFFHTPRVEPSNNHDGNHMLIRADWHPALTIMNDMDLGGARDAEDNRRASLFFGRNGVLGWRFGQGSLTSETATDNELMNLCIVQFDGPQAGTSPLIVSFITNNWLFNTGSNAESANYHFKAGATGYLNMVLESLTTQTRLVLRNSDGGTDDVEIRNSDGNMDLAITSLGPALTVVKATRDILIGTGTDDTCALVNITSTTQGFLPPRMTTTQRDAIGTPAAGLLIYNTTTGKLNVRGAAAWEAITSV